MLVLVEPQNFVCSVSVAFAELLAMALAKPFIPVAPAVIPVVNSAPVDRLSRTGQVEDVMEGFPVQLCAFRLLQQFQGSN